MKQKTLFIIAIATIILFIAFAFVMMKLIKENSQCISNPFTYAANRIVDNKGEVIYSVCSCNVKEVTFYFDNKEIYPNNPLVNNSERRLIPWLNQK